MKGRVITVLPWWIWLIVGSGAIFVGYITLGVIGCRKFWKSIENDGLNNLCIRRLERK